MSNDNITVKVTNEVNLTLLSSTDTAGVSVILSDSGLRGLKGDSGINGTNGTNASGTYVGPELTRVGGLLTRIDYDGGAFKAIDYNADGTINTVTLTDGADVSVKTFNYTGGALSSITQS